MKVRMLLLTLPLLLLLPAGAATAAGENSWADSVFTEALSSEQSLQEVLNDLGYSIDVSTDEIPFEFFETPVGKAVARLTVKHIGTASMSSLGWHTAGDNLDLNEIFPPSVTAGSAADVSFSAGEQFGLYLGPTLYDDIWFSETGFNWDNYDHIRAFPSGIADGYVLAWEDLPDGGDQDFQDVILEVEFKDPDALDLGFSGDSYHLFCIQHEVCFDVIGTGGSGQLTISIVEDGIPTPLASGASPFTYQYCLTPWPADSIHQIAFMVEDEFGTVVEDTFLLEIKMQSRPVLTVERPFIDTTICELDTICFNAVSVYDEDGDAIEFTLYEGEGVIDPVTGEVCFLPDTMDSTDYLFVIRAADDCCDAGGGILSPAGCPRDTVIVRVHLAAPPQIITIPDTTISLCVLEEICFEARAIDGNGDPVPLYQDCGEGSIVNDQLCFTPQAAGFYQFCFFAYDDCGGTVADTVDITIVLNQPPFAFAGNDSTIFQCTSEPVCWQAYCSDPDDNLLSCELIDGSGTYDGSEICFDPQGTGVYRFILEAVDDCGENFRDTVSITVEQGEPPVATVSDTVLAMCEPFEIWLEASCSDPDDDLVSCELITATGIFEGGYIKFVPDTSGTYTFIVKATDACGLTDYDTGYAEIQLNIAPVVTPGGGNFTFCEPDTICMPINVTDPGDEFTVTASMGVIKNNNQLCVYSGEVGSRQFVVDVVATDTCGLSDTAQYVINILVNMPPELVPPDLDPARICEAIELCFDVTVIDSIITRHLFELIDGPGLIDPDNGQVCFTPSESGVYNWTVAVEDSCGLADTAMVVWNVEIIDVPDPVILPDDDDTTICFGIEVGEICFPISYDETDVAEFHVDPSHPGIPWSYDITAGTGEVCFTPELDVSAVYSFTFTLVGVCDDTVESTYSYSVNYVDCDTSVCLILEIEQTECLTLGSIADVDIRISDGLVRIGGYDLLIQYDVTAFSFLSAEIGSAINGWEYFTYRQGPFSNCGGCPTGLIRLVALADMNNGPNHPPLEQFQPDGALATMSFRVTSNTEFSGRVIGVNFFWFDCGDNGIATVTGDTLLVDRVIYNPETILWDEEDDINYPEAARIFGIGIPDDCMQGDKNTPLRCVDFWNGSICIIHLDSIDARGDMNLNGLANEIADGVLFTNYFLMGPSVFKINYDAQSAASDVNRDGVMLSVGDLVYMLRIITGDAVPYPKLSPWAEQADITIRKDNGALTFGSRAASDIGALYAQFKVAGESAVNIIKSSDISQMELEYNVDGDIINLLIYSMDKGVKITSGISDLFTIEGVSDVEMLRLEAADYYGSMLSLKSVDIVIPTQFELSQNYPNPFNPETVISMHLPEGSEWTLAIFNINGRLVHKYTGESAAGVVNVTWDATDQNGQTVATGVYFYRATAGNYSATKKMLLMK